MIANRVATSVTDACAIAVPYFGGVRVALIDEFWEVRGDALHDLPIRLSDLDPGRAAALGAFLDQGPDRRLRDSRHVHAYYRDVRACHGMEFLDEEMGIPVGPEAIWDSVTPGPVHVARDGDGVVYVVMQAECAWDEEHGLQLVWRDGRTLTRVGPYDGGLTNPGTDDGNRDDVVYAGLDPALSTRLEAPVTDEVTGDASEKMRAGIPVFSGPENSGRNSGFSGGFPDRENGTEEKGR